MERVQLNLERLLPELRDLEKKKLFTKVGRRKGVGRRDIDAAKDKADGFPMYIAD